MPIFVIFQISALADMFFGLANVFEAAAHFLPLIRWCRLIVLSNKDRSLSNNQIELLNKIIKMYTKNNYDDCFYTISNRKSNIIIISCLPSAFSKYAFI